jgi:hypothetical protein
MHRLPGGVVVFVSFIAAALPAPGRAAEAVMVRSSIAFADARSERRFEAYRAVLQGDPVKYAGELATIEQLARSDVTYVVTVVAFVGGGAEGRITTDGQRVLLMVTDVGGPGGEVATLNSRLAHELEHARQVDAGELALARDPKTGAWASQYSSYDLGDEVKAWNAQLDVAVHQDFWFQRGGVWWPTLLRRFANERTDEARARVLARSGYSGVNPTFGCNVRFGTSSGYAVGQVVRPSPETGSNVFGRVWAVEPDAASVAARPRGGGTPPARIDLLRSFTTYYTRRCTFGVL